MVYKCDVLIKPNILVLVNALLKDNEHIQRQVQKLLSFAVNKFRDSAVTDKGVNCLHVMLNVKIDPQLSLFLLWFFFVFHSVFWLIQVLVGCGQNIHIQIHYHFSTFFYC